MEILNKIMEFSNNKIYKILKFNFKLNKKMNNMKISLKILIKILYFLILSKTKDIIVWMHKIIEQCK